MNNSALDNHEVKKLNIADLSIKFDDDKAKKVKASIADLKFDDKCHLRGFINGKFRFRPSVGSSVVHCAFCSNRGN